MEEVINMKKSTIYNHHGKNWFRQKPFNKVSSLWDDQIWWGQDIYIVYKLFISFKIQIISMHTTVSAETGWSFNEII